MTSLRKHRSYTMREQQRHDREPRTAADGAYDRACAEIGEIALARLEAGEDPATVVAWQTEAMARARDEALGAPR